MFENNFLSFKDIKLYNNQQQSQDLNIKWVHDNKTFKYPFLKYQISVFFHQWQGDGFSSDFRLLVGPVAFENTNEWKDMFIPKL